MARPELRMLIVASALLTGACDGRRETAAQVSITVKLPPARPHAPAPGFKDTRYRAVTL